MKERCEWATPDKSAEVGVGEAIAMDGRSRLQRQRSPEHRPRVDAGVEFAALATGVNFRRQFVEQSGVEVPAGEGWRKLFRIHAGQLGAKAARDHLAGQLRSRLLPERK